MDSFKVTYWSSEHKLSYIRINDNRETIITNLKFHHVDKSNLISIELVAKQNGE